MFANAKVELGALFFTIAATITVKFLADITMKVTQLFSGIQIQSPILVNPTDVKSEARTISPVTNASINTPISTVVSQIDQ